MKQTTPSDWQAMNIDETPLFRKAFAPWYDSGIACLITVILMAAVFLFGAAGLSVAQETPAFSGYIWLPALLMALSSGVVVSITVRLIRRRIRRKKKRRDRKGLVSTDGR